MINQLQIRAIVSLLLVVSFVVIFFTGIGLYLAPSGRIAREVGWNFLGADKESLENLHTVAGFFMSILVLVHLSINYKLFLNEIKALIIH